jgi:hypothetical protein
VAVAGCITTKPFSPDLEARLKHGIASSSQNHKGSVMLEVTTAVLLMFSTAVFLAHTYDALHTR